jgi:hypothetical protein
VNKSQRYRVGLPTGQAVARKIKAKPLTPQQVAEGESEVVTRAGFDKQTPLWFYILKESQVQAGGQRLGEVGSRIGSTNSTPAPASRNGKRWRRPTELTLSE